MLPSEIIRLWGNCEEVDSFIDHVLTFPKKASQSEEKEESEVKFDNRAKAVYKKILVFLEEHLDFFSYRDIPALQKIKENIKIVYLHVSNKSKKLARTHRKVKKVINVLLKKEFPYYIPENPLTTSLKIIDSYDVDLIKVVRMLACGDVVRKKQIIDALNTTDREGTIYQYKKLRNELLENGDRRAVLAMETAFAQLFLPVPEAMWLATHHQFRGERCPFKYNKFSS